MDKQGRKSSSEPAIECGPLLSDDPVPDEIRAAALYKSPDNP